MGAFSEMHGSSSYLFLLNLFLGVIASPLQLTGPSLPEKFAQLQSSAAEEIEEAKKESLEKVFDCSKKVEKVEKEESLEIVDGAHRSTGLIGRTKRSARGIPEEAIMRSLRSPSQMSRVIRQGVQNHAILRSLRSSVPPLGVDQDSLMRSLRSRDAEEEAGVDSKRTYKINLPEDAMMRSLRSDEETGIADDALLRSLRSYEPSVVDAAMMRSLRSSYNPNVADAALLSAVRSKGLNIAGDAFLRSLRSVDKFDINKQALMRSLRSFPPTNITDAAMMRALRGPNPKIADKAIF